MSAHKKRYDWIDIARGIAILIIAGYHSNFIPFLPELMPFISSWMIVIFVLVGGLLFKGTEDWNTFLWKKFQGLMVPYVVYGGISYLLWLFFREMYAKPALWMRADDALKYFGAGHDLWFNATLWFLPCYFLALLFARAIYPLWEKRQVAVQVFVIGLLAAFSLVVMQRDARIFMSVDIAFLFTSLILLGKLVAERKISLHRKNWVLFILTIVFLISAQLNGAIDLFFRKFDVPLLFFFHSVLGSLVIANIAMRLEPITHPFIQGLRRTGKYSLVILVTHWPLQQLLTFLISLTGIFSLFPNTPTMTGFIIREQSYLTENIYKFFLLIIYTTWCVLGAMLIDLAHKKIRAYLKKS